MCKLKAVWESGEEREGEGSMGRREGERGA
jgi:hypothetical protein